MGGDEKERLRALEKYVLALEARIVALDDKSDMQFNRLQFRLDTMQRDEAEKKRTFASRLGWLLYG